MHLKPCEGTFLTYCLNWCNLFLNDFVPSCSFNPSFIRQALPTGLRGHFSVLSYCFSTCLSGARMKSVHFLERCDYSQRAVITSSDFSSSSPEPILYVSILIKCAPSLWIQECWTGVLIGLNLKHVAFSRFWESGYSMAFVLISWSWAEFTLLAATK